MTTPKLQQALQIRSSLVYDDSIVPSEANFEASPDSIRDDLDNLRSAVNHLMTGSAGNWFDQLVVTAGAQRGVNDIAQAVESLELGRGSFTPYFDDRPIYVRNTGNDANDGSTVALAVATVARGHQLFNYREKAYSKQYLELTGFNELIPTVGGVGAQYVLPTTIGGMGNIFGANSFDNGKQDFLGEPIGYYADPVSTGVAIDIASYTVDPLTGLKIANLSGTIVAGAHVGDFISVGPGEYAVIHSNTTNTLTIASTYIFSIGPTEIYTQSCTLTLQTLFGLKFYANSGISFSGIRFAGNAVKIFTDVFTYIHLCRFDGGFYTEGPGALVYIRMCYFGGSRMQVEGSATDLGGCVLQNMELRSHGSGGNGRNALHSCIVDSCTAYGSSNHEQNFDVEVNNCLFENAIADAIHKQSPYQCLVRNTRINNSVAHAIRADVGGGKCLLDNVEGIGNGGYGLFLANGAQANATGTVTVEGALGEVKVGASQASLWTDEERTDKNETVPELCRILTGATPGLGNGLQPEVTLIGDLPVKGTQAYTDAPDPILVTSSGTEYRKSAVSGQSWTTLSVGAGTPWTEQVFTATLGQITFILGSAPTDSASVELEVNGVSYNIATDYTRSGTTITWLNGPFSLEAGEIVKVRYQ